MSSSSTRAQLAAQGAQPPDAELPEPVFANPSAYRAPETSQQETLCSLFAEALGVDRVGLDDSFFDLGGQSLNGIRLVNLINKTLGSELSIDELFDYPTAAELDEYLQG
ncbi:phosphopantetheine-binding protein [Dactylosporangium sp. NPDC005555]|uniref:phosphopantetheine-binding protein n=1 Tax=Dactylosporangium sp. NPDC005555 TaxID=3154889 RepID=UPI0033A4F150